MFLSAQIPRPIADPAPQCAMLSIRLLIIKPALWRRNTGTDAGFAAPAREWRCKIFRPAPMPLKTRK
jgi:hypothetical protein